MSKSIESLNPPLREDRAGIETAAKSLAGRAAVTASLLLASSVTLASVDSSITLESVKKAGPSIDALANAIALLEDEGVADAARNAKNLPEIAQWDNWSNFQNY